MVSNILFPNHINESPSKQLIELFLYADEIKRDRNKLGEYWQYLGLLIVSGNDKNELFNQLMQARKEANYYGEMHFADIQKSSRKSEKTLLGKKWIEIALSKNKRRVLDFHILGLNLSNLQSQFFGEERQEQARNIYNRFFRSTLAACLKYNYADYANIKVKNIFHDKNELEYDEMFDWHTIWRINIAEENVYFNYKDIHFIDSDHQKEQLFTDESHFIQLIDLILGATRQCIDCTSKQEGRIEISSLFLPLVERLNDPGRAYNPNSKYSYHRRCCLYFFPKESLTLGQLENEVERLRSGFYRNRPILLQEKRSRQLRLFRR